MSISATDSGLLTSNGDQILVLDISTCISMLHQILLNTQLRCLDANEFLTVPQLLATAR